MKKMIITLATAGLVSFGASAFAGGNVEAGKAVYTQCAGCHGMNAEGGFGPKLAGRPADEIAKLLHKYKAGEQVGPQTATMAPIAQGLSEDDINNVSAYVSSLK